MTEFLPDLVALLLTVAIGFAFGAWWAWASAEDHAAEARGLRLDVATLHSDKRLLQRAAIDAIHHASEMDDLRACAEAHAERLRDLLAKEYLAQGTPRPLPPYTLPTPTRRRLTT